MENYRHFLELQNTDPKLRAEALRRLGDLNLDAGEMQRLETGSHRGGLAGGRGDQAVHDAAQGHSPDYARKRPGALSAGARLLRPPASPGRRSGTLGSDRAALPRKARSSMRCSSGAASCCSPTRRYADAERAYAAVHRARRPARRSSSRVCTSAAGSLFKQSLALESLPSFGGVLDQELGTGGGKSVRLEKLKRARSRAGRVTPCGS